MPTTPAYLHVSDVSGDRVVPIIGDRYTIGRRESNVLQLGGTEVSREHAEVLADAAGFLLRDLGSRYGTFVNDVRISERKLQHGDRIRLGHGGGADLVFTTRDPAAGISTGSTATPMSEPASFSEIRVVSALLDGLSALGPGYALDDVLALVLDSAIRISAAERGAIMLATPEGTLEWKLARGRNQETLKPFLHSRQVPETARATGQMQVVRDLLKEPGHLDTARMEIRYVLCVPLHRVRLVDGPAPEERAACLGVLYLDSSRRGTLLSDTVRAALKSLAAEAAMAIENARLYRDAIEHARADEEMRVAATIQNLLLPLNTLRRPFVEAHAASRPCHSIGGDFFDYADLPDGALAFMLGDAAGKGPSAALLSALALGMFSLATRGDAEPTAVVDRINDALCRRGLEARFLTLFYGVLRPDGRLTYCSAGHNPPVVIGSQGVFRLQTGGTVVGILEDAAYDSGEVQLSAGDRILVFSDGLTEAMGPGLEEFGDARVVARLEESVRVSRDTDAPTMVEDLINAVVKFTADSVQHDDMSVMLLRYRG